MLSLLFILTICVQLGNTCSCSGSTSNRITDDGNSYVDCIPRSCAANCAAVNYYPVYIGGNGPYMITQCESCADNHGADCLTCNVTRCLSCPVGYSHNGAQGNSFRNSAHYPCVKCSDIHTQCTSCSTWPDCETCSPGYVLNFGLRTCFITQPTNPVFSAARFPAVRPVRMVLSARRAILGTSRTCLPVLSS
jgi:hypothetical protein